MGNNTAIRNISIFLGLVVLCYGVGYWLIFRLERASPLMLSVAVATAFNELDLPPLSNCMYCST